MIETEDARPEDNAKDYEIDPKQVSGKFKKILNEILNEMKSSRGAWGEWGAWGDCCTGNLELKKGEGLKYSDNPEAVQVRHRYGVTTGCTATMILTPSQEMPGRSCWWLGTFSKPRSQRSSL